MSFVKSILQQWRDRNLKKNTYSDSEQLIVSDIPGTDIAEQHLLEALARQINDAVNNGKTISSLNVEIVYEQLAESLDRIFILQKKMMLLNSILRLKNMFLQLLK